MLVQLWEIYVCLWCFSKTVSHFWWSQFAARRTHLNFWSFVTQKSCNNKLEISYQMPRFLLSCPREQRLRIILQLHHLLSDDFWIEAMFYFFFEIFFVASSRWRPFPISVHINHWNLIRTNVLICSALKKKKKKKKRPTHDISGVF